MKKLLKIIESVMFFLGIGKIYSVYVVKVNLEIEEYLKNNVNGKYKIIRLRYRSFEEIIFSRETDKVMFCIGYSDKMYQDICLPLKITNYKRY